MDVKVYRMNDYDFVASHLSLEATNEWYSKEYDNNELDDVKELNIEIDWMWYEIKDMDEKAKIFINNDLSYSDKYKQVGFYIFEKVTLKEALERDGEYKEPYIIASTEF